MSNYLLDTIVPVPLYFLGEKTACIYLGFLHKLKIAKSGQLQGAILQGVLGLVHDEHVQNNVILVHVHVGLSIHGIRKASQLSHLISN
jgi:hypothetical protein